MSQQTTKIEIYPIAGRIGAEIRGVQLSGTLDAETIDQINQALLKHKVVFFRGQEHLDDAEHEKFASLLGELLSHPSSPSKAGTNAVLELDSQHGGRVNSWHTDITFIDTYPKASILRAVSVPQHGGDTIWANTVAAYEELSPELKEFADRLWVLHSNDHIFEVTRERKQANKANPAKGSSYVLNTTVYETEHPLVRVIPETGEKAFILGHFVRRILGVSSADSKHLIALFQDHITRLENTVRWRWKVGDVAIWENRTTQHYAVNDYGDQHRVVRRVTVAGDVPISVSGEKSVTRIRE